MKGVFGRLGGLNDDSFDCGSFNDDTAWRFVWPSLIRSFCSPSIDISTGRYSHRSEKLGEDRNAPVGAPFSAGSSASASTSSASCCSLVASSSPETTFFSATFLAFDVGAAAAAAVSVLIFLPRLLTGVSVAGAGAALRLGRLAPPSGADPAGCAAASCSSAGRTRLVDGRRGDDSSLSSMLSFRASSTVCVQQWGER